MKRTTFIIAVLIAFFAGHIDTVESKCCPPPPLSTSPVRTLPRTRTSPPPPSNLTLPPQSPTGIPTPSPGLTTQGGPVTATNTNNGTRTTANRTDGRTNIPTNVKTSAIGSGRPDRNVTPRPSQPSADPSNPKFTTAPPPINPFEGSSNSPIIDAEFDWEGWWEQNTGYLLASYRSKDEVSYTKTDLTADDIPKLITLLSYRGLFDKGIHSIVSDNLSGIDTEKAVHVLAKIIRGKYKFKKNEIVHFLNKCDYPVLGIRALGCMNSKKATDAVAGVLLREYALTSSRCASDSRDSLLLGATKDSSENERYWACLSLGSIGDKAYIPVLNKILEADKSKYVRAAAAESIAMIGGVKAVKALEEAMETSKKYYQTQTFVAGSLGVIGSSDPMDDIHAALRSSNGEVRASATWALSHLLSARIESSKPCENLKNELITSIKSELDESVCNAKALALLVAPTPELIDVYTEFLSYRRIEGVRIAAAIALGMTGSPESVESLVKLAADTDSVEKARAYAITLLLAADKTKVCLDLFSEEPEDDMILASSIMAIADCVNEKEAYKTIYKKRNHIGQTKMAIRASSFCLARGLGDRALSIAAKNTKAREDAKSAFAFIGLGIRNSLDALKALNTKPKTREVRKSSAIAKGLMGGLPIVAALKNRMKGGKDQVRAAALVALGCLNRPEEIDFILDRAQNDPSFKARAYALAGLANVVIPENKKEEVVSVLTSIIKDDKHYMVQGYAAFMLSKFPESRAAFEAVRKAVNMNNSDLAAMAAVSLGMFKNPAAAKDINNLINRGRGTPLAYAGYIGLGMMENRVNLNRLISAFEFATTTEEYVSLSFAIANSATKNTYAKLLKHLKNPDVFIREYAIKCIAMMKNLAPEARKEVIEEFAKLEDDSDYQIRFFAGITRYSFGDKSALKSILDTITNREFFIDNKQKKDYYSLMQLVNKSMPQFYRMKPYFWSEDE